jgi:transcriptional regulator with PAS, ATPase and Fis domain
LGQDPKIIEAVDIVKQVADTPATVLITGESGTGKELIARALHKMSFRCNAPFIAVNTGAIAETLQESELFGHTKGAFTGASERHIGKFEAADGGTIFLDEISEMGSAMQVKLLRVLQSGEFSPLGVAHNRYCDVRVVAASNMELLPLVDEGKIRKDLYYRLNIIQIDLPPLRERRVDIPLLIQHFVNIYSHEYNKPDLQIDPEVQNILLYYDYPGNIRELENIIQRAWILCRDNCVHKNLLPKAMLSESSWRSETLTKSFHEGKARVVEEFERSYLTSILKESGGIVSRAALRSGLSEQNFHVKLKKYGIEGMAFRSQSIS